MAVSKTGLLGLVSCGVVMAAGSSLQAAVLFNETFTGQSTTGTPTNFTVTGLQAGETATVVNTGTNEVLRANLVGTTAATRQLTSNANLISLPSTADKLVHTQADFTLNSTAGQAYRLGLQSSSSTFALTGSYALRFQPYATATTAVVDIITTNNAGAATVASATLSGTNLGLVRGGPFTLSFDIDFSNSNTSPVVTAYSGTTQLVTSSGVAGFAFPTTGTNPLQEFVRYGNNAAGGGFDTDNLSVSTVAVPEPTSLALLAAGSLIALRRRRQA